MQIFTHHRRPYHFVARSFRARFHRNRSDHISARIFAQFYWRKAERGGKKFEIFFSEIYGNVETFFRGIFSSNSTRLFSSAKRQYKLPCYKQLFFPSYHRVDRTCMAHDGYLIIIFSHLFARTMLTKRKSPPQPAPLSLRLCLNFPLFISHAIIFFCCALKKKHVKKIHIAMLFCKTRWRSLSA